jgi:hypothetical protein
MAVLNRRARRALAVLLLALPAAGQAATYYVAPTGDDANPGTEALPWASIQRAADVVAPGDTVLVAPGDYGRTTIRRSGQAGSPVVFRASTAPDRSHVNFSAPFDPGLSPWQSQAFPGNPVANAVTKGFSLAGGTAGPVAHVRIENFEITAIEGRGGVQLSNTANIEITGNFLHDLNPTLYNFSGVRGDGINNADVVVRNNTLFRVAGTGIQVSGARWLVEGNELAHGIDARTDTGATTGGDVDAFRFFGSGHVIRDNYAHDYLQEEQLGDPHMDCFQTFSVYPDTQFAYDVLVEGNTCDSFGQMFMSEDQSEAGGGQNAVHHITFRNNVFRRAHAVAIILHNNDYFTFANNVVAESWYIGIRVDGNSHHATVVNNIFYNNYRAEPDQPRGQALTEAASKVGSAWDYNIHYPDFTWPVKQPEYDQHGMYGVDPGFVDPVAGDYRLRADSPAVDKGVSVAGFDYDKDRILRPRGAAWDIGAYEYGSGADTTPPAAPTNLTVQ